MHPREETQSRQLWEMGDSPKLLPFVDSHEPGLQASLTPAPPYRSPLPSGWRGEGSMEKLVAGV